MLRASEIARVQPRNNAGTSTVARTIHHCSRHQLAKTLHAQYPWMSLPRILAPWRVFTTLSRPHRLYGYDELFSKSVSCKRHSHLVIVEDQAPEEGVCRLQRPLHPIGVFCYIPVGKHRQLKLGTDLREIAGLDFPFWSWR